MVSAAEMAVIKEYAGELSKRLGDKIVEVINEFDEEMSDLPDHYKRAARIEAWESLTLAYLSYEALSPAELFGILWDMMQKAYNSSDVFVEAKMMLEDHFREMRREANGKEA